MSANEQIGRLRGLLERVQMRAGAPRGTNGGALAAESVHGARTSPPPAAPAQDELDDELEEVTQHYDELTQHAARAAAAEPSMEGYDVNTDSEVEVSSETVDIDIDMDEPMAMESGAQPIAHQTTPPEELQEELQEEELAAMPSATQPPDRPPAHEAHEMHELEEITHVNMAQPLANEIEEPAPSSSRRPIAGEEPAPEAYEAESSPRHTPPPESGKQVAAPSVRPPSMKPSAAPPSLEGHTLIGGWREPGLVSPQISPPQLSPGASTGVRVPAPSGMGTEPPATVNLPMADAQASGPRLTADVTKPALTGGGNVASFEGAAAVAKPATLGELLDLTLGL